MLDFVDRSGRRISILHGTDHCPSPPRSPPYGAPTANRQAPGASSIPGTPDLVRGNSYDSHIAGDPISPRTPLYDISGPLPYPGPRPGPLGYRSSYDDSYAAFMSMSAYPKRRRSVYSDGLVTSVYNSGRVAFYDGEYMIRSRTRGNSVAAPATPATPGTPVTPAASNGGEKTSPKRYPCRYKDRYNCDKSFTTSGHASRHARIHTAEKAVHCTFPGCPKKFTRADNMKQHLETHTKGKHRSHGSIGKRGSSASSRSLDRSRPGSLTLAVARTGSPGGYFDGGYTPVAVPVSPGGYSDRGYTSAAVPLSPGGYSNAGGYPESLASPALSYATSESHWDRNGAYDMRTLPHGPTRPSAPRAASGLETLAMAANAVGRTPYRELAPLRGSYGG